ncbi:MAG: flippase-like domain-containing protein [Candidatus Omnitrophica bacterium]|nr:flippase-like domain-containing protein [Candidatus Omnitrophota bacterium]
MKPSKKLTGILKALAVLVCLALIVRYFSTHTEEFELLKSISPRDILALIGILFVVQATHCFKLYLLVLPLGLRDVPFWRWFGIITVSRFVNQHMLQGAHIYRFLKLKKDYQFSYTKSLGFTVYYLWIETVSLLAVTFLIIGYAHLTPKYDFGTVLATLAGVLAASLIGPAVVMLLYQRFGRGRLPVWDERVAGISDTILKHVRNPRFLIFYGLITVGFILVYLSAVRIGFAALGVPVSFYQNVLFTVVLILTRMFNIVPANIGVSELVCGTISEAINISFGSGILVAGIVRIVNYLIYGGVTLGVYAWPVLTGKASQKSGA